MSPPCPAAGIVAPLKDTSEWRSTGHFSMVATGGYLRGMTRAFQQGQLNLMGSLIGLSERKRQDQVL
jgi:hypothetical protein